MGRDDIAGELGRWITAARRGLVVVDGEAGIGKSRLVAAAVDEARGAGRDVVTVRAHHAASTIPFGAFAPVLVDLPIDGPDELGVLTALSDHFRDDRALVVDDLPLLDAGSTAAVLHAAQQTTVLATARTGQVLDPQIAAAAEPPQGRRITPGALSSVEIEQVLRAVLDGPIDPGALQRLARVSSGNPLFLRELVTAALASGSLRRDERGWQLLGLDVSPRLVDAVADRLDRLEPEARRAAELIAASQPLPLGTIEDEVLDALELAGVVSSDRSGMRVAHPIYDEVLRAACTPSRWRRRQREGADLLAGHGADEHPDGVLRIVQMRTAAGAPVDPAVLATAARRAHELLDHDLAVELATAAIDTGGERYDPRWVRGAAHSCLRRNDEAERDLRAAVALAGDDEQLARALQRLGLQLAARSGRTEEALRTLQAEIDRINDPAWRGFVDAEIAKWELSLGRAPTTEIATADPAARLNLSVVTALSSALDGRFAVADAAIEEGLPLARSHRGVLAYGEELLLVARYLCLALDGDAAAADAFADHQLTAASSRRADAVGTWRYLQAQTALAGGRIELALERADVACEHLLWRDMIGLLATARAVRAGALARLGRAAEATDALAGIDPASRTEIRTGLAVRHAEAWLLVGRGQRELAAAELAAAGRDGVDAAHAVLGALVAHEAVGLGFPGLVVEQLQDAAGERGSRLLRAMADHAEAAASADADALDRVSRELEQVGLDEAAADASSRAAAAHRRRGRSEHARRSDRRAAGIRSTLGPAAPPVLTARELEVAVAAAGERLRSREIAERLGLSARTVDNHLNRAYRKLGVADRVELAAALRDLGLLAT